MKRHKLGESELVVSSFCLGAMPFGARISGADVDGLVDSFREAGGNFFDTAHCYCFWTPGGAGCSERELGRYVRSRACRDEVVIATKGAHPPVDGYRDDKDYMTAARIAADIDESLERLQMDTIDLFWLHRDDPRIDVGTIVDILNAEVARGSIRAFGGSNWTSQRFAEAARYAREHGVQGFAANQPRWNLLSLSAQTEEARLEPGAMVNLHAGDRQWHTQSQMPVIPYNPTAGGFFATRGEGKEGRRTPQNLQMLERAETLARELNVTPNQVALAWLLSQPFPVIPILGTTKPDHLADGLGAEAVPLSLDQCRWLEEA